MQRIAVKFDNEKLVHATSTANCRMKDIITRAFLVHSDPDNRRRINDEHKCVVCFYLSSRIGGAAMTTQPCGICNTPVLYASTNTDSLCFSCALDHKLCKHCGADIDLNPNRKEL